MTMQLHGPPHGIISEKLIHDDAKAMAIGGGSSNIGLARTGFGVIPDGDGWYHRINIRQGFDASFPAVIVTDCDVTQKRLLSSSNRFFHCHIFIRDKCSVTPNTF